MGNVLVNDAYLYGIADALREKYDTEKKYLPSEMEDAVRGIQSGGTNALKYATTLRDAFKGAIFEEGAEIEIDCRNELGNEIKDFSGTFQNTKGLKKLTLSAFPSDMPDNAQGYTMYGMFQSSEVEILDLSGIQPLKPRDIRYVFYNAQNLKQVIGEFDLSILLGTGYTIYAFVACTSLEEIRFKKETINAKLELQTMPSLSNDSVQSFIDGLVDLTGQTTQTIQFSVTVKAKLTESQIATITSKNWTLA